jgi:hypothetical protein
MVGVMTLPAEPVPEAAGLRRLRRRDPDQQGNRRQRAQDELHRYTSRSLTFCDENNLGTPRIPLRSRGGHKIFQFDLG